MLKKDNERYNEIKPWITYATAELRKMHHFNYQDLIAFHKCVPDTLHLLLRITENFLANLADEIIVQDNFDETKEIALK